MILALIASGLCVAAIVLTQPILDLIPLDDEVRSLMAGYIVIRLWSGGAAVGIEALANYFGGLGQTRPGMVANVMLMATNVLGNWLLIRGHWGCPALGVRGAAWASTVSTCLAFGGLFGYFLWTGRGVIATRLRGAEFARLVRFGLPSGFNWFLEIFAFIFFINAVVASLGTTSLAAMNSVFALNSVSFMPAFGLASGGAILVGQAIGAGAKDLVPRAVTLTTAATLLWQGATGVAYFFIPDLLIAPFAQGEGAAETLKIGVRMLFISASWQLFDAVATTLAEALRAAGDTTFPLLARLVIAWLVFVPGSLVSVHIYHWSDAAATSWIVAYLALLAATLLWRFRTGAWRQVQLLESVPH
jgi:multidrug resistance protein, MATE family